MLVSSRLIRLVRSATGDINCPLQCYNGGSCLYNEQSEFLCECPVMNIYNQGYAGIRCETPFTLCQTGLYEWQCNNDSECDVDNTGCICGKEFSGAYCELGPIRCLDGLFCYNGASCREWDPFNPKSLNKASSCRCQKGFKGENCEIVEQKQEGVTQSAVDEIEEDGLSIVFIIILSVVSAVVTSLILLLAYKLSQRKKSSESGGSKESDKTEVEMNAMNSSGHSAVSEESGKKAVV